MFEVPSILEEYGLTLNKKNRFYVGSKATKEFAFHVFMSFSVIEMIRKFITPEHRRYLVDGTFKIAPSQFRQLLIISIEYKKDVCISKCAFCFYLK